VSITLPVAGSANWDIPLNLALARLGVSVWQPNDHNMITYSTQPQSLGSSAQPASGGVRMSRIRLLQPATINNLHVVIVTAGVTLTVNQSFLGLYSTSGTLLAITGDQSVAFTTTGFKTAALTAPFAAAAGDYFAAVVTNGTTTPAIAQEAAALAVNAINAGLAAGSAARFQSGPAAQTTLPASINMVTDVALNGNSYWMGAS
jgi:hypothetical protein